MNKLVVFLACLLVFSGLAGCSGVIIPVTPTVVPLVGELTFAGSTTIQPLAGELGNTFQQQNPQVKLDIAGGGSKVGIQAIHDGTVDIGMASRALTPVEAQGITTYTIALDVIALVVHPDNPVEGLDMETLAAIYRGEITNWNQVGGQNLEIVPITRETSSGTRGAFDDLVLSGDESVVSNLVTAITAGDVASMVAGNPAAIGYIGFGNLAGNLKVLSIVGVFPSQETARSGEYPLMRPLNLMIGPLSQPLAMNFINFVLSEQGQQIVEQGGWVRVK